MLRVLIVGYFVNKAFDYWLPEDEEKKQTKSPTVVNVNQEDSPSEEASAGKEDSKEGSEEDSEEEWMDLPEELPEDAIFIPLWFARKRPRQYYQGSDPEWQDFLKFARDQKRGQSLRSKALHPALPPFCLLTTLSSGHCETY